MAVFLKTLLRHLSFIILFTLTVGGSVLAEPIKVEQLPEDLQEWVPWVLWDQRDQQCPYLMDGASQRICAWASPLDLKINGGTASFNQKWELFAPAWVPLPGNADYWPQELTMNGAKAKVLENGGRPALFLTKGTYTLAGTFIYQETPESFPIPPSTGVLRLSRNGQVIPFPQLDQSSGMVWLKRESTQESEENRLNLEVHRQLIDDIPFTVVTRLTLNVSGQSREVVLPKVLLKDFLPLEIKSPIPARMEAGGELRLQVKPGNWNVELTARHRGPVEALGLGDRQAPWPEEEIWVFAARNDLRLVWVEGVPSIDPQQTTLPAAWKNLPAYRMAVGDTLKFVEKRRGNSDPAPDDLSLFRQWWLDFDGKGFTINDQVDGVLRRSWRLEMNKPIQLGRISVDGQDQFITTLPGSERQGIEVRQGRIQVNADSRLNDQSFRVPAIGWNHDFQSVSGELNLPPGWDLFSVVGADRVPDTWVESWTLLDIFLVMILTLTVFKLFGWKWGLISFFTYLLTFPESGAPRWIWLALLVGVALYKLLSKGKLYWVLRIYRLGAFLILLIMAIPFMVEQVRVGIYPALEHPYEVMSVQLKESKPKLRRKRAMPPRGTLAPPPSPVMMDSAPGTGAPEPALEIQAEDIQEDRVMKGKKVTGQSLDRFAAQSNLGKAQQIQQRPGAKVQTGPGLPRWNWNRYAVEWNGPVQKGQDIEVFLIPPWLNLILAFLRVGLLALLILGVLEISGKSFGGFLQRKRALAVGMLAMGIHLWWVAPAQADFPSPEILKELSDRLLAEPECFPNCASLSRMEISSSGNDLVLRLEAASDFGAAIPLPGALREWSPNQAAVDGQPAHLIRESDEVLWLQLPPGAHQVLLSGPIPEREAFAIPLPLKPRQVRLALPGWNVEGLDENGVPESSLQLSRSQGELSRPQANKEAAYGLVPFVRVERELILGLNWEVYNRVVRVSPKGVPVVLEVPLLAGESVTTPGIRVEGNQVLVNMAANSNEVTWRSVLAESPEIQLQAPENRVAMEEWTLDVSPVWHVEFQGIPRIHADAEVGTWLPRWRPWPGESLKIQVIRPEGVPGKTLTIDQSLLKVTPGQRFSKYDLGLRLRSSLGGQHVLVLPDGVELQEVKIDGKVQPIRLEQDTLTIPVNPGSQMIQIEWQQAQGIAWYFQVPEINLGSESVNAEIQMVMPQNRWILYTGGPRMGPAVMFWSLMVVLLLFAVALSRLGWAPLNTWQWFLLGVGISQFPEFPVFASVFLAGWLLFVGYRDRRVETHPLWFDTRQILLVAYTFFAILALFIAIHQGLLGHPEMQIAGNGSSHRLLRWFQDRSPMNLPQAWVFSVPLYFYRLAMLAWALWIALALIKWLKWTWVAFNKGGAWRSLGILKKKGSGDPKPAENKSV